MMELLDAINLTLPKLGERRVTSLDTRHPTLAVILPEVEQTSRELLLRGWWFNTFDLTLYPSSEGEILLGSDVLVFMPNAPDKAVQRGRKLFNPNTLTYVFTEPVKGKVRLNVEFDQLPESAAIYVYYTALVTALATDIGAVQELAIWNDKANTAYGDLVAEHIRQRKMTTKNTKSWQRLTSALKG